MGKHLTRRLAAGVGGGLVLMVALSGCSVDEALGMGWPKGVTPQSHRMYDLWIGSLVAALAVGIFTWALIFWCIIRYRKRGDQIPPQIRYNVPIEVAYTVVPFLIVAVLFYYTAVVQNYVTKTHNSPDVRVEVTAFKWNWQFRYPDAKDEATKQPVQTIGNADYIPVLVVPTGKRIRFNVTGKDVVHSFWVPELLFKRDAIPGYEDNAFEVTIDKAGAYVGRCAELCGTYHSQMNFEVRAVSPTDFQAYLAARSKGASTPDALRAIGQEPLATTTHPFDTDRTVRKPS